MKHYVFFIVLIVLAIFIYISEGVPFNGFTVWNMLPLFISLVLYTSRKKSYYGAYGFLIGSMLLSGFFHLAWLFDWWGSATGSSTGGFIFIFIPIYALIPGGLGLVFGNRMARNKEAW
jgi:hypothetical protein